MKVNVYAIFDKKAKMYASPFFLPHDPQAIRAFGDLVVDPKSSISVHPEDYSLYRLTSFDDCSGMFGRVDDHGKIVSDVSPPDFLAHASDFGRPDSVAIVNGLDVDLSSV